MIPGGESLLFVAKYLFYSRKEREALGGELGYFVYFVAEGVTVWLGFFW